MTALAGPGDLGVVLAMLLATLVGGWRILRGQR